MSSDKEKLTLKGLIEKILEPSPNVKGASSRQQSHFTALVSLIIGTACLVAGIAVIVTGGKPGLIISMITLAAIMAVACALGRTENYQAGAVVLVSGMILAGFLVSASVPDNIADIMILMATIVPALLFAVLLIPTLAIIIISIVTIIAIGILPLMAVVNVNSGLFLFMGLAVIEAVCVLASWFREITDNQQLEEIGSLRGRLEERVEERTRFTRIAAEIAQEIISSSSLEEVLNQTVNLITARFGFSYTGVYLADETEHFVVLKAAQGQEAEKIVRAGKRLAFGPPSLLGWVAENKQQRVITRIVEDFSLQLEAEFLTGSQSEIGIPILSGDRILGVMDVQSTRSTVFDNETIVVLQMLANQIATGIQNVRLFEVEQGSVQELAEVYLTGYKIIQSSTEIDVYQLIQELFSKTSYVAMFLTSQGKELKTTAKTNSLSPDGQSLPELISVPIDELEPFLGTDAFIGDGNRLNSLPYNLVRVLRQYQIFSLALIPVIYDERISATLFLGTQEKIPLGITNIQPYINLGNQIATSLDHIHETRKTEKRLLELETITHLSSELGQAKADIEVLDAVQRLFQGTPNSGILLKADNNELRVASSTNLSQGGESVGLPERISVPPAELLNQLGNKVLVEEVSKLSALYHAQFHPELQKFIDEEANQLPALHVELIKFIESTQFNSAALIPVVRNAELESLIIVGTQSDQPLSSLVGSYSEVTELVISTFDRIHAGQEFERQLTDDNSRLLEETRDRAIQLQTAAEIAKARTDNEIFEAVQQLFQGRPNTSILLVAENNDLRVAKSTDLSRADELVGLPELLNITPAEIYKQLGNKVLVEDVSKLTALFYAQFHPELQKFIEGEATELPILHPQLIKLIETVQFKSVALIPINRNEELIYLIIVGVRNDQSLSPLIGSYNSLSGLVTGAFNRIRNEQAIEHRLNEDEVIIQMGQEITSIRELPPLYQALHTHIRQTLGDVNFSVAIFDANTNSITIPYMFEKGSDENDSIMKVESFPLGEGLTSIPIRTKQPLMLVEDTEKRAIALGAKITGKPPKSWLGTPLIVADEVVGAIVVQDIEHEFAFDENDLRFLTSLSGQVAGTIYNTRLLGETRNRAIQLQTAAEIARDISGLLDLGELLNNAVTLICERFNYYHASIFLVDAMNEYAHIREATGEAGTQMKRAGHKLKVGSKSIVGYVTGSGEPLIVNDTNRDATYFANPLLPETRAEVAIPLKVGQRILGALDVQSTQSYSFAQEDISVLRILADQMAIAVINSELFADTQEHLSQSRLLHHVTTAAASGTTIEEALNGAVQGLQVTLGGDRVSILLADETHKFLMMKSLVGYSEEVSQLKIPFGEGITGWVAVHQQPQRINDVAQDLRYIQAGSNVHSELAVPLLYRGELLGVLNVESDQTGAYNENDEEMLGTLGGSLAAIIANARLIEQVRRQVDRERLLYEVTSKIRRSTDMQTIMTSTATELSKALGARRTQIKMGTMNAEPRSSRPAEEQGQPSGD